MLTRTHDIGDLLYAFINGILSLQPVFHNIQQAIFPERLIIEIFVWIINDVVTVELSG